MRPLAADDPFIQRLTAAVAQARAALQPAEGWPTPAAAEVVALCNRALQLCVSRYEGDPIFTTLFLYDAASGRDAPGFLRFAPGPDWRALARGFPDGLATHVRGSVLLPFAGLTVPLSDAHRHAPVVTRALVLPGVVGVTVGGELLAELRPGQDPQLHFAPRPSFDGLLREAGLPATARLRPLQLRRILQSARQHRHGATVVVTAAGEQRAPDAPALVGASVDWRDLQEALEASTRSAAAPAAGEPQGSAGERSPGNLAAQHVAELVREYGAEADRLARALGRLTTIDGALFLNHDGALLGFGLRLSAPPDGTAAVMYSDRLGLEPIMRNENPLTGSRRRSALDYVAAHAGCFALVLSSDGPLSLVSRRGGDAVVVQRGLECLL